MLDPAIARSIVLLAADVIDSFLHARCYALPAVLAAEAALYSAPCEKVVVVGPEMAGGALVAQLASLRGSRRSSGSGSDSDDNALDWCDYAYLRKERKKTGARQQLEGPAAITERTPDSLPRHAIVVDDALSTGASLKETVELLRTSYALIVVGAFYLVDRSSDRRKTGTPRSTPLLQREMDGIDVVAAFDIDQVRACIDTSRLSGILLEIERSEETQERDGSGSTSASGRSRSRSSASHSTLEAPASPGSRRRWEEDAAVAVAEEVADTSTEKEGARLRVSLSLSPTTSPKIGKPAAISPRVSGRPTGLRRQSSSDGGAGGPWRLTQVQIRQAITAAGLAVPSHEQLTAAFVEADEEGAASLSFLQLRQCCLRLGYH